MKRLSLLFILSVTLLAAQTGHTVTLNWDWPQGTNSPATGFNVKRSPVSGGPYTLIGSIGSLTTTSYKDISTAGNILLNGATYYYVVTAIGRGGESAPSNEASATIPPLTNATGAIPISVSPASGSAGRRLFNFLARDLSGAGSIQYAQFLFSKNGINALNACYISYDPNANVFYLLSDDLTQWYGLLGGSANTIGNAQCTIYGATSGSTKVGTDLTTTVDISFRSGFGGAKMIYQFAGDTLGAGSGWNTMGTWNDTGDPNAVELISLTPSSGTGASQVFTAVVRDGAGANNIPFVQLVMNTNLSGFNGCFIYYDRASNVFYLLNDAGTVFSGLFAGSAAQVSNSQCTLHGVGSGGTVVGSNLTITYNLDLSPTFGGLKETFMQAVDNTGVIEVWRLMGTWTQ